VRQEQQDFVLKTGNNIEMSLLIDFHLKNTILLLNESHALVAKNQQLIL